MSSRKSPLRDRLLSNSPDPIKSSILRESGMGWSTSSNSVGPGINGPAVTSPLRISKRGSPTGPGTPGVARRSSSSYRHMHTNNLVSKSPFKSQIPTPATPSTRPSSVLFPTRRVSGEKRPRPISLHEQSETENDRPFALKRERMQSQTFQGLLQKEPVTKSPFKRTTEKRSESPPPSVPPLRYSNTPQRPSTPPSNTMQPPSSSNQHGTSPYRSALVSKRMHGPRLSGGGKRERRKTVTFHERCDVLEFELESEEGDSFRSAEAEQRDIIQDQSFEEDRVHILDEPPLQEADALMADDASYESIQLSDTNINPPVPSLLTDPDVSINGLVDEMLSASGTALTENSFVSTTSTPPRHGDLPTDLETEDGVPFGRTHHVERFLQHQNAHSPSQNQSPVHFSPHASPQPRSSPHTRSPANYPFNLGLPTRPSPSGPPATPPRRSPAMQFSTPPLGRSTHMERIAKAREDEQEDEEDAEDVSQLPASPSPMKRSTPNNSLRDDALIPKFDLSIGSKRSGRDGEQSASFSLDIFDQSRLQDQSAMSELESDEVFQTLKASPGPSHGPSTSPDCSMPLESSPKATADIAKPFGTPSSRSASPLLSVNSQNSALSKSSSRERISREEIQRRLVTQRNTASPSPTPDLRSSANSTPLSTNSPKPSTPIIREPSPLSENQFARNPPIDLFDRERDRMSVLTTQTDFSVETAIIETAEKRNLGLSTLPEVDREFGFMDTGSKLQFDFGSKFSLGGLKLPDFDGAEHVQEKMDSPPTPTVPKERLEIPATGMRIRDFDVDMDSKSALDRLMEDVAGAGAPPNISMTPTECSESFDCSMDQTEEDILPIELSRPKVMERAATDSALLQNNEADGITSRSVSGASTITIPPPVPPKDSIRTREQLILEKRREARRAEEAPFSPNRPKQTQQLLGVGRPSRRRSMSTGDAETLGGGAKKRGDTLLDIVDGRIPSDDLGTSIERELHKLGEATKKSKYHVRERETTIIASSTDERISHMAGAGDLDAGRAWRAVRRPSDMNEYAKQIKDYRAQDKGKAYGKVFVKVLGIRALNLPLPQEPTAITCTLNNGIHFVTTPECPLGRDSRIEQEFELIEHSKLEFTLTLKVRRDPHIVAQFKAVAAPAPAPAPAPSVAPALPPVVQTVAKSGGMRSFFSSSPKKHSKEKIAAQAPPPPPPPVQFRPAVQQRLPENLARHMKPDGTLARAFVSFKEVAGRCDSRLFETSYPLIGQRVELGGKYSTLEVGEIVLQMFRLPPLPGLPQDQLPQSLDECIRGLRHINWHKITYFQGTLTQSGGDCNTWRRRQLRVIGSNLVAFNDVTKRATAAIDLKKAISVQDDQASGSDQADDLLYGVERSFRLIFPQNQEIIFFADTDEEKARWLEVLRALVGRIPPHPLWAELLWQRQEEISKRMAAAQQQISHPITTSRKT